MINEIQAVIAAEFSSRSLEAYTQRLNPEDLYSWADEIARIYRLDANSFGDKVGEFFYATANVQLSLGYTFLAFREVSNPSGKTRNVNLSTHKNQLIEDTDSNNLADYHFWYHLYNSWECLYRSWERAVNVLVYRFTPNLTGKYYFSTYRKILEDNCILDEKSLKKLKKFDKAWGKIAKKRNEISHESTNFFHKSSIDVQEHSIVDVLGRGYHGAQTKEPNLKQELNSIINHYKKSFDLLKVVRDLCALDIAPMDL